MVLVLVLVAGRFWLKSRLFMDEYLMDELGVTLRQSKQPAPIKGNSPEGHVKCNPATLTCLFSNLFYYSVPRQLILYTSTPLELMKEAGALMLPGIGSPSDYYYLDTWTYGGPQVLNSKVVQTALHQLAMERNNTAPDRHFYPIYVQSLSLYKDVHAVRVDEASILFSVLWPHNLFRVLYAGAAALFSLYEWDAALTSTIRIALTDPPRVFANGSSTFHGLYEAFSPGQSIIHLSQLASPTVFSTIVVGLSRKALLGETELAFSDPMSSIRTSSYRLYASLTRRWLALQPGLARNATGWAHVMSNRMLGMQGPLTTPRVAVIVRRDGRRQIRNLLPLLSHLRTLPITFEVVAFEDYPLADQVRLVHRVDIMVAVHGAALSHLLFMRPGAAVIEIFPYGFRKTIYRNLAALMGVQYASWQCARASASSLDEAMEAPLDWASQTSKERWRNQNVTLDLIEFSSVLHLVMKHIKVKNGATQAGSPRVDHVSLHNPPRPEQYLMYLPWEQFNNQLIGFKSACAVAHFLNRTLVVPPIGYRKSLSSRVLEDRLAHTVRVFAPKEFEWQPWTRYFDPEMFAHLPCRTTPFAAFTSLTRQVRALLMRRLGQSARVNLSQLQDFYFYIAGLEYEKSAPMPAYFPLYFDRGDIDRFLAKRYSRDRVLCLGSMFWMYSFGAPLEFPARSFQSKMPHPLYRQITAAFRPHSDLLVLYEALAARIKGPWNAIHLRRGDYAQKCYDEGMGASQEASILRSCYQRPAYLAQRIKAVQKSQRQKERHQQEMRARPRLPWLMATNDRRLNKLQQMLRRLGIRLVTIDDLLGKDRYDGPWKTLDPIEWSILDQLMCIHSTEFIGNYFSSFTRTIADHRDLRNATSQFF